MLQNKEELKNIDHDERGNPLMTLKTIKYFCVKENLYETPDLNEKLYLQYKGFKNIDGLENYPNLVAAWLNNNSIVKIQGLNALKNLSCLYLQNNSISKIQNLDSLPQLSILSLAHNKIQKIQGLQNLINLNSFNVAENFLLNSASLDGLLECPSLTSIDLSKNQLQNTQETFNKIAKLSNISCMYLKATPFSRGFKNYRKRLIAALKKLKFLDDRPVQEIDHRIYEAWVKGGPQLEQEERQKIAQQKQQKNKKQVAEFQTKTDREVLRQEQTQKLEKKKSELEDKEQTINVSEELEQTKRRLEILKQGPKGFQAKITDTSIKILQIDNEEEEKVIIDKYFSNEKKKIEENIKKLKQKQAMEKPIEEGTNEEQIAKKVKGMLNIIDDEKQKDTQYRKYWKPEYEPLLQALLEKYKFDFAEVQPSFNMIMAEINKKMVRVHRRFEIPQLRRIWTELEIKRRKETKN